MKTFCVIIPAYNAETTIDRTLASLISNRDYIHEVIVVDDRCTDKTITKAKKYKKFLPIKVIKNTGSHNPGSARKTGLLEATGQWVTFVDADDCLTAGCLKYVSEYLEDRWYVNVLYTKLMYYESGAFKPEHIARSDMSCGGNFYKTPYLISHGLLPHDDLDMAEDEYFNEIVLGFIKEFDRREYLIDFFDYPTYEVHHDISEKKSYALQHWVDYVCKWHLIYKKYVVDFFKLFMLENKYFENYIENFIFCYYMLQGVLLDDSEKVDIDECMKHFRDALEYFEKTFKTERKYMIDYYNANTEAMDALLKGAIQSVGIEFEEYMSFETFIEDL